MSAWRPSSASIDRGGLDPTRAAQVRRYEDALNRQQAELDRVNERSRRRGCQGGGFFSLFTGQPPECAPLNRKAQEMRDNIDRMTEELQRLQGSGADREGRRNVVLDALVRNDCGPQYRSAAAHQQRGLFETLFGPGSIVSPGQPDSSSPSGTYRTVCVRTCDGFYFPISFSTVPSRFPEDERTCQRLCPAAQAELFTYPNPGGDINQATSVNGMLYTELPNAFLYRKQYNPACSCKRVDQTWSQALSNLDAPPGPLVVPQPVLVDLLLARQLEHHVSGGEVQQVARRRFLISASDLLRADRAPVAEAVNELPRAVGELATGHGKLDRARIAYRAVGVQDSRQQVPSLRL